MVSEETGQPHQSEILKSMQRIAEILSGHSSFGDKCDSVLRILVDLMPADLATLRRPDETGNDMVLVGRAAKPGFEYEPPAVVRNQRLISYQSYQDKEIHPAFAWIYCRLEPATGQRRPSAYSPLRALPAHGRYAIIVPT